MKLKSASLTDIGRVRGNNQDSYVCDDKLGVYAVADGLGGHVGGEVASGMAADILSNAFRFKQHAVDPGLSLKKVIQQANSKIYEKAHQTPSLMGMGTTLTMLYFADDTLYVGHVGDSRAYLIREGMIWQLSQDHSLASYQLVSGMTTPLKNVVTRSVGFDQEVEVDVYTKKVSQGDTYLLCSDGLHGFVKDEEIARVVSQNTLNSAVKNLIILANERGGEDNITAVLTQVEQL